MSVQNLLRAESVHIHRKQVIPPVAQPPPAASTVPPRSPQDAAPARDVDAIKDIIGRLPAHLSATVDSAGAYEYDASHLAAKCARGHKHKYFLLDIAEGQSPPCKTCSAGKKSVQNARQFAEDILGTPLTLYSNPGAGEMIMRNDPASGAPRYEFFDAVSHLLMIFVMASGQHRIITSARYCILVCYIRSGSQSVYHTRVALGLAAESAVMSPEQRERLGRLGRRGIPTEPLPAGRDNEELMLENC